MKIQLSVEVSNLPKCYDAASVAKYAGGCLNESMSAYFAKCRKTKVACHVEAFDADEPKPSPKKKAPRKPKTSVHPAYSYSDSEDHADFNGA